MALFFSFLGTLTFGSKITSIIAIALAIVAAILIFKIIKKTIKIVFSLIIIAAIAYAILNFTGVLVIGGAALPFLAL